MDNPKTAMEPDGKQPLSIREVDATPYAAALIEGHRDFGYSLETALADVIDNSISAGAKTVQLVANTAIDAPVIIIADDGCGMSELELIEAMRLGSKNPKDQRAADDLGRFGLGLKSASFSQCRSLTVITRSNAKTSCARWDLDRVSQRNDWSLELLDHLEAIPGYELLQETGTVVIWQQLDRLTGGYEEDRSKRISHMNREVNLAERHLRLVFHRFLDGRNPKLRLSLNGRPLQPIDPMAASHPSTQKDPEEVLLLSKGNVRIQCYTLPHHKKMSPDEWDEIGGPEGHLKSQGIYVYRENRLIIAGGWLGLVRQTELTKLCRIAIDIPNTMDSDWKIDVKKASAQLPPLVRERLKKIVERFVGTSKRTYRGRGQTLVDESRFPVWNRSQKDGQISFQPNFDHPVFKAYSDQLPDDYKEGFYRCLRLVGSGLPIDTLYAELLGNPENVVADQIDEDDLRQMVSATVDALIIAGISHESIADTLKNQPLFKTNWHLVENFLIGSST